MGPRRTPDDVAAALGRRLGGTVQDLRPLSGGASRLTSSFDLRVDGGGGGAGGADGSDADDADDAAGAAPVRRLILQLDRGDGLAQGGRADAEAALLRAAHDAGVPVPSVVALGDGVDDGLGAGWLVVERLEGETIPRKILRDPEWSGARQALTQQCARALAAIHTIDPASIEGLPARDPFRDPLPFLDALGEARPALELGVRWLEANRLPAGRRVTVHGDFRTGNLLVGPDGLRAVLDWELAHAGEAAEDIGWLCAPAWRFGGPGPVGGFGALDDLLEGYAAAGGTVIDPARVKWWQVYATVKWAVICALQASTHLSGATRSVELAAIGRRVCESEWDLCTLLGLAPDDALGAAALGRADDAAGVAEGPPPLEVRAPFGRPTATELVEAVREYLEAGVMEGSDRGARFTGRVARNALLTVEREIRFGPAMARAHAARLAALGFDDDRQLAVALRSGTLDRAWGEVGPALAAAARDQLLVANPAYLDGAST
jgi:aminoglycoside phosphotransferase (APT) family kinase protein